MTCRHVKVGEISAIVCGPMPRPKKCRAHGVTAAYLCDWKLPGGGTCDAPLCGLCTTQPADGKDLCPEHAREWEFRRHKARE